MESKDKCVIEKEIKVEVGDIEVTDGIVLKGEKKCGNLIQEKVSISEQTEVHGIESCDPEEEIQEEDECKTETEFLYNEEEEKEVTDHNSDDSSVKTKRVNNVSGKQPARKRLKQQPSNSIITVNPDGVIGGRANAPDVLTTRGRIIGMWEAGTPVAVIAEDLGVSRPTAYKWISRWQKEGCLQTKTRSGRPRSTTLGEEGQTHPSVHTQPEPTTTTVSDTPDVQLL